MRTVVLLCGDTTLPETSVDIDFDVVKVSAIPTRQELKLIDATAQHLLPHDLTPSLDDIAASPDVAHLGTPRLAPQQVTTRFRVIVVGSDAALSAVLTRMMRADYMWVEVGYVPIGDSTAAQNWALPADAPSALHLALTGPVRPVPLIRNDAAIAVAGSATISTWDSAEFVGEIIVDDSILTRPDIHASCGARLVPMLDAPGIAAARAVTPFALPTGSDPASPQSLMPSFMSSLKSSFLTRVFSRFFCNKARVHPDYLGRLDATSIHSGRALQAGGPNLRVSVDGVSAKRPVKRSTFYRHLRDLQIVR
ncbi:MAG: hypothetical protein SOW59_02245 [Corynebacterium sp.]|nr:hypothetical protein [Corynebacterium sp.]